MSAVGRPQRHSRLGAPLWSSGCQLVCGDAVVCERVHDVNSPALWSRAELVFRVSPLCSVCRGDLGDSGPGGGVVDEVATIRRGPRCPLAIQVADQWHLLHNLSGAAERIVSRHWSCLRDDLALAEPAVIQTRVLYDQCRGLPEPSAEYPKGALFACVADGALGLRGLLDLCEAEPHAVNGFGQRRMPPHVEALVPVRVGRA